MTRSKCQNRELVIVTVVNRNDLHSTWRGKNGQFVQGRWWQRAIYCTIQTSKTSAFQSLWEIQTMTKDLWNVNSKSTYLNHTLTVVFCFLPYKLMTDLFQSTTVCFISLLVFARNFHKTWEVIVLSINQCVFSRLMNDWV